VGSPEEVRNDPAVGSSYLGGVAVAIERSGASQSNGSSVDGDRCQAITRAGHRCTRPAGADGVCAAHRQVKVATS
jgi:hypothetical protein